MHAVLTDDLHFRVAARGFDHGLGRGLSRRLAFHSLLHQGLWSIFLTIAVLAAAFVLVRWVGRRWSGADSAWRGPGDRY